MTDTTDKIERLQPCTVKARMHTVTFSCPSCNTKLASVEAMQAATQIVFRTCRKCGDRWMVKLQPTIMKADKMFDIGTLSYALSAGRTSGIVSKL